jgi:hypothetical protein
MTQKKWRTSERARERRICCYTFLPCGSTFFCSLFVTSAERHCTWNWIKAAERERERENNIISDLDHIECWWCGWAIRFELFFFGVWFFECAGLENWCLFADTCVRVSRSYGMNRDEWQRGRRNNNEVNWWMNGRFNELQIEEGEMVCK